MSGAARLARLLGDDGRCLDVAIDHGVFNEPGFLPGIEDMARAVETAWGLKALSMKGSKASSVGMPRRSISSTM